MHRRQLLTLGGAALAGAVAGCLGDSDGDDESDGEANGDGRDQPSPLEDPPDGIYVPSHVEGMEMADMGGSGRYRFALAYSFPHPFWLVTGGERRVVEIQDADSIHMMLVVWDDETGTILPSSNTPVTVTRDGETVDARTMWLMLSQNMGVHFGDNVALDGDGTYQVEVDYGPVPAAMLGDFQGALGESASVTLELAFSSDALRDVPIQRFADRRGDRDAVDPMEMGMLPNGQLPAAAHLPGTPMGTGEVGDAIFVATALDEVPAGMEGSGTYLAVSARTRYNRYPIPRLPVSVSGAGGDVDADLQQAVHPDLGFHYGAVVDGLADSEELSVSVASASTVARHEGYETAFMQTGSASLS